MTNNQKSKLIVGLVAAIPGVTAIATTLATALINIEQPEQGSDQETVDELNIYIADATELGVKFNTMTELVTYLSDYCETNLEELHAVNNNQFVWDSENNVVFSMKKDGSIAYAPQGYTLNTDKSKIWKMVNYSSSKLASASNIASYIESFKSSCDYGQYIRKSTITGNINFSTSVDTGLNQGCNLVYKAPSSATTAPVVVTNRATLTIEGSISDINHYGSAITVTVTDPVSADNTYNEYGTVDSKIVVTNAVVVAEAGSDISTVYIKDISELPEGTKVVTIEGETEEEDAAFVGTVATSTSVETLPSDLIEIDTEHGAEEPDTRPNEAEPSSEGRYAGGYGTKNSPYLIDSVERLKSVREDVANASSDQYFYFKLIKDIDLNNEEWTPIGAPTTDESDIHPFRGVFDGNGCVISNLKVSGNYNVETCGFGLFGWTDGAENTDFNSIDKIWDSENKHIILDNITENSYKTCIKNVTIENVNIDCQGITYGVGGVVGWAKNTLLYNNTVKTGDTAGSIKGYKHVGGITGTMVGSTIMNCMVGNNEDNAQPLDITAQIYNVGGISGSSNRHGWSHVAYVYDATGTNTTVTASDNQGGGIGGVYGYDGNSKSVFLDGCENRAKIVSVCTADPQGNYVGGISGYGSEGNVVANCINYGDVSIPDGSKAGYVAGITNLPHMLIHNCYNYGNVKGYATQGLAGVCSGTGSGIVVSACGCDDNAIIENTNDSPATQTSRIAAGITSIFTFENQTFANVEELSTQISSHATTSLSIIFKNCTVTDTTGSLTLPTSPITITSDTHLCDNVTIDNNVSTFSISMPNTNITVTNQTAAEVNVTSDNATITIANGGKVKNAIVSGTGSKVVNNGTVSGTIAIDGNASYGENNGTCNNVVFGYKTAQTQNVEFKNSTTGVIEGKEADVISVQYKWGSPKTVTFNNYGKVYYQNGELETSKHMFKFGYPATLTYNCYVNSETKTDTHNWFYFGWSSITANLRYQTGATIKENDTPVTFESLATEYTTSNVTVTAEQF